MSPFSHFPCPHFPRMFGRDAGVGAGVKGDGCSARRGVDRVRGKPIIPCGVPVARGRDWFPGRRALVVGGGEVALRKARTLADAGAHVF